MNFFTKIRNTFAILICIITGGNFFAGMLNFTRAGDVSMINNGHAKAFATEYAELVPYASEHKDTLSWFDGMVTGNGEFEPQIIKKNETSLTGDIEEKILSMYAKGMTTNDISAHIEDIYGLEVSDSLVSRITDKILPVVKEWQQRPLESIYAVVFMDAIHYNVRSEGRIIKKAVYIAIGINMDGMKEVLDMYVGENESSKYWLSILNDLKNRGVEDILITCIDGLIGFPEAISAVYPKTEIQQCIIHQIRNSTKYVSYKDIKALMADLKSVYGAVDEETALYELEQFSAKWDANIPRSLNHGKHTGRNYLHISSIRNQSEH